MKVLVSGLHSDRVELNLVQALHSALKNVFVITVSNSAAESMCRQHNIPFTAYDFRHRFDRNAVRLYRELQDAHRFDIFHCLTNRALSTGLRAIKPMRPAPKIVAYRGTMGHLSWFDPASHFSYLSPRVDTIICVSDAVRRYLKTFRIADDRLNVIWKGHDASWYQSANKSALAEFGIPSDGITVCFTGNIRPVKGVNYLIKAFDEIKPEQNIHLLVIGEVREKNIIRQIGKQPHIHFAGFRKDATSLAGACDIAVMPSIEREGLPKAVLESMSQGIPAIVTDVGGLPELVLDGETGLVVPPRDANALRSAILTLAGDAALRKRMGLASRRRVEGDFNFRHTVDKTIRLYQRLLARAADG
jgi:glycosyltransferase involved in cell wall biosynthesis